MEPDVNTGSSKCVREQPNLHANTGERARGKHYATLVPQLVSAQKPFLIRTVLSEYWSILVRCQIYREYYTLFETGK